MKYKVVGKLDEQKYKNSQGMDSKLWPNLKDKEYTLGIWPTLEWAKWSAKSHREYQHSNLDLNSIRIRKIED